MYKHELEELFKRVAKKTSKRKHITMNDIKAIVKYTVYEIEHRYDDNGIYMLSNTKGHLGR